MTSVDDNRRGPADLQIDADLAHQRRVWRLQRAGWLIAAGVLLAAALGYCGAGPLTRSTAGVPGSFSIEYDRFVRLRSPSQLIVRVDGGSLRDRRFQLFVGSEHARSAEIESVMPPASAAAVTPDGVVFTFDSGDAPGPLEIVLGVKFTAAGAVAGRIGLHSGPPVRFDQWVYP
jgi:hypothetical protein